MLYLSKIKENILNKENIFSLNFWIFLHAFFFTLLLAVGYWRGDVIPGTILMDYTITPLDAEWWYRGIFLFAIPIQIMESTYNLFLICISFGAGLKAWFPSLPLVLLLCAYYPIQLFLLWCLNKKNNLFPVVLFIMIALLLLNFTGCATEITLPIST